MVPPWYEPQLAVVGAPTMPLVGWTAEPKLDGWRVQAASFDGVAPALARRGHAEPVGAGAPEQQARDDMLGRAGRVVQDYKAVNLYAGLGVAVREVPA